MNCELVTSESSSLRSITSGLRFWIMQARMYYEHLISNYIIGNSSLNIVNYVFQD